MGLFNLTSKIGGDFPSAQDPQKRKAVEDGGAGLTLPAKRAKGQFIQFIHLLTVNHFFFKEKTGLWHLAGQFFFGTGSASDGSAARTFRGAFLGVPEDDRTSRGGSEG